MYRDGLPGARPDPRGTDQLLGELLHPIFEAAFYSEPRPSKRPKDDYGKGKVALLYKYAQKFDPTFGYHERQTTGDCVSHGCRNAAAVTQAVDILQKNEPEGWHGRIATEPIYGCRGHGGQGMSCSRAAKFVADDGGLLLRKKYDFVDLSEYNSSIGSRWGSRGVPEEVRKEGQKHQVQTVSLVTTVEGARDAIAAGYGINVCSGHGFSSKRDEDGFARRSGGWSHAMAWVAVDDEFKRPGFLVQNSWGKWNSGPKRHDQPDGSFWIDFDTAEQMLRGRGAWVMSGVDGFPPMRLPSWGFW